MEPTVKFLKIHNLILTIFTITLQVASQPSPYGFKNQFIKNMNNIESQINLTNLCHNYWCTYDANYLFTQSSQYSNIDPCVDFKNFSLSNTIEISHVNDRKVYRGLLIDAENKQQERLRKVLSEKITKNDGKIVKIIKQTFVQCLKSQHTFRHLEAHQDIIDYLLDLGGSPYLIRHIIFNKNKFNEDADYKLDIPGNVTADDEILWNKNNFDLSRIFIQEPHHAMSLFFGHIVGRCENNVLCVVSSDDWGYVNRPNFFYIVLRELLENLEDHFQLSPQNKKLLKENVFIPGARHVDEFMKARKQILEDFSDEKPVLIKIRELKNIGSIGWLEVINNQLMKYSNVDEDEYIRIKLEMFKKLGENLEMHEKNVIADTFVLTFLYSLRHAIILRFHNIQDTIVEGRKQTLPRFERCIKILKYYVAPGIEVMYEIRRPSFDYNKGDFNRSITIQNDISREAEKLVRESLEEMKRRIITEINFPMTVSSSVLRKLMTAEIIVGFTNETFRIDELERFYEDLNLNGSERFLKSVIEMRTNSWKIKNEVKGSWRRKIEDFSEYFHIKCEMEHGNYIFIPPLWIIYPIYHPQRPRFFNMATLFQTSLRTITKEILVYAKKKFNYTPTFNNYNFEDNYQVTYECYTRWLKNNTELEIGANYLTNQQLYWMAVAVAKYLKYHRIIPATYYPLARLQIEYMHVWIKTKPGFQDAFHCQTTEEELTKTREYVEKYTKIYEKSGFE